MADLATILSQLTAEIQAYTLDGFVTSASEGDSSLVREAAAAMLAAVREARAQKAADDLALGTKRPVRMTGIYGKRS